MSSAIHASTSFLRSRLQLLSLIEHIQEISKNRTLLYALSHNAPDLEQSVKRLSACTRETIGCLSAPIQTPGESRANDNFFSCSIAVLDTESCQPFSTLKAGEGPLQVGRWHSFRKKDDVPESAMLDNGKQINWEDIWNRKSNSLALPPELLDFVDSQAFLYFCDGSAWDFAKALHEHAPYAYQLGISASSTPFVTGMPFTLLRNGKPQSSGAVGIALRNRPMSDSLNYSDLVQLTRSLPVRRAEGNLIHAIGESLPARILLKAIEEHGLPNDQSKEADYYIGLRDPTEKDTVPLRMHRIIAGDPSRGSIAVEDVAAPPVGSLVEFYYRPKSAISSLPRSILQRPGADELAAGILFSAFIDTASSNESIFSELSSGLERNLFEVGEATQHEYHNVFNVSTENGFIFGGERGGDVRTPWKCTVPGAFGGLYFPNI